MFKKLIYKLISWIDDRSDRVCWADMVFYAKGFRNRPLSEVANSASVNDCRGCGICWCGKFEDGKRRVVSEELNQ